MLIGKKLRELREARRMSLTEISKITGIQMATLSRIENMKMTGTLDSHLRIAKALGLNLTQLYSDVIKEESVVDVKSDLGTKDIFVHSDKSSHEILTNKVLSKKMMPILLKIEPGGRTNEEQSPLGTERFIFVIEGKIEVHVEGDKYELSKNSTLYFDSALRHYFVNIGKTVARVVSVSTPVSL